MTQKTVQITRADYGLDAPTLVQKFLLAGCAFSIVGVAIIIYELPHTDTTSNIIGNVAIFGLITGVLFLCSAGLMIWSSKAGKMHARDALLDSLHLQGNETVLDVGCGRGLLLLGAAKRLPQGKALGIDLWSQIDLQGNSKAATMTNAQAEGVAERVEIVSGDMRKLPFADSSIDVVVANLSIHNIYNREGRKEAINEIVRVLKPGGKVALMDFEHVKEYGEDLKAAGMQDVHVSGLNFWIYPPVRIARGRKG